MPRGKKSEKKQYYTIQFEKYLEVLEENSRIYYILCDKIKDMITSTPTEDWDQTYIADFLDFFVLVDSFRIFLDEKINNPTEEETEFILKHDIKDVLFDKEELALMQQFFLTIEGKKEYVLKHFGFSSLLN